MVGDFNVDVSNHNHPLFSRLFSVTSSFALYQVVKSPTHYYPSGNHSTIDLAFVSSPFLLNFCTTIPPLSSSDHQGFILSFRSNAVAKRPSSSTSRTVWCYNQADFEQARELLEQTDWNSLCPIDSDMNQWWSAWQTRFLYYGAMYTYEGSISPKTSPMAQPWSATSDQEEKHHLQSLQAHRLCQQTV